MFIGLSTRFEHLNNECVIIRELLLLIPSITPNIAKNMRSLRVDLISYRSSNERLIKAHEEHNQINASILQSFIDI